MAVDRYVACGETYFDKGTYQCAAHYQCAFGRRGGGLTTWSPERILHVIRSEPNPPRRFGKPVMSGNQYKNHRLHTCLWAGRVYLCASYRECYVGDRQSAPEQIGFALM